MVMASCVAVLFGDKIRSQSKPFLYLFQLVAAKDPVHVLVYNSTSQISGRIFSYNQSFRDIGNVTGPLIGASVSANYGFRAVFLVTAGVVLFNAIYSTLSLRRPAADTSHSVN